MRYSRRHVDPQNRWHHSEAEKQQLWMDAGQKNLYSEVWRKKATRRPFMERQAPTRGDPNGLRGLLRATLLRQLTWVQTESGMPHGTKRHLLRVERNQVVYWRRHQGLLRTYPAWRHPGNTGQRHQGQSIPQVDPKDVTGRLHGRLAISQNLLGNTARWGD